MTGLTQIIVKHHQLEKVAELIQQEPELTMKI